ncbi:Nucleoside 2-deoxyribosyltransferase [Weissella viridescens]|uniref:Nucleoside 2-deoxyribosyltransferase n=1 Tax=Weissella viridescens TaxID=1629 RepID=A0A380P8D6_WEIVI|nr:Nucleoside 2-deoxyribosyltransferase [Weissella viridescens]
MEQALTNNPTVASFFSPRSETCAEFEMGTREWAAATFKVDRDHIDQADVVVAVIDYVDDLLIQELLGKLAMPMPIKSQLFCLKKSQMGVSI